MTEGPGTSGGFRQAEAALAAGDPARAESIVRGILGASPFDFSALLLLGRILSAAGRHDDAVSVLDEAAALRPGHSGPFSLRSMILFRRHFGPPPARRAAQPAGGTVTMRLLGMLGRFGNQLLQYAFVRLYAERHGLAVELPDWIGRDLFDCDDPPLAQQFPTVNEDDADFFASLNGRTDTVYANRDLVGFFCRHTSAWGGRDRAFRALFVPGARIRPALEEALASVRRRGRTLVAIHLRRGDFGFSRFWIAPAPWYIAWLEAIWPTLDAPVLYIASDDPAARADFAAFAPVAAEDLAVEIPGAEFMVDHYILANADHLALSNSTFSFTAAMLNERARTFVRPHPDRRALVPFDPWAAEVQLLPEIDADAIPPGERALVSGFIRGGQTAIHVGNFCSAWTNYARLNQPALEVVEIAGDQSVDKVRREQAIRHVSHLVIEPGQDFESAINGSLASLRCARIDAIHFRIGAGIGPSVASIRRLQALGYRFFRLDGTRLAPISAIDIKQPASHVAIHERLISDAAGKPPPGLDLVELCRRHRIRVRGVIHVGAHEGQELPVYDKIGAKRVLFVEANPAVFARLVQATAGHRHVTAVQRAISDRPGKVELHLASHDQSSSLLALHRHREIYPQIVPAGSISVDATTLDALLDELRMPASAFNLLTIDVQGAEDLVLKGAAATLAKMDAVCVEVNFSDLYRGAAEIEEIEARLTKAGLKRVALASPHNHAFGDALYLRA